MSKIVLVSLVFMLLLGSLAGPAESPACALSRWEPTHQDEQQSHVDPCEDETTSTSQPEIFVHTAGCGCVLLPQLTGWTAVTPLDHTPFTILFWPSTAVVLPLTPPPRAI